MLKQQLVFFLSLAITSGLFAADMAYPLSYREAGLPEYENAVLTELGRDNTSLRDGISINIVAE